MNSFPLFFLQISARFWAFFHNRPVNATHTRMDAIKKKMQAMKLEKDNAMDRADACEQQAKDANLRAERVRKKLESGKLMGCRGTSALGCLE